jgi:hypothetical protein
MHARSSLDHRSSSHDCTTTGFTVSITSASGFDAAGGRSPHTCAMKACERANRSEMTAPQSRRACGDERPDVAPHPANPTLSAITMIERNAIGRT